ncbi:MAG: selenocysteine-specific translation elongation factor [bacterium]
MRDFILGTAGHVDHGKTELVRALTGIDPDRLPEEKRRGLTIDLGFAHLSLPGVGVAGIVDVPGHERFLKNMLAGVGGYEMALLVIDAREGIREQTREHLEILRLLAIPRGLVALTKSDLVSQVEIDLLRESIREFLRSTFLEEAPIISVSSLTGSGIPELKEAIGREAEKLPPPRTGEVFRLPIDRVFVKAGFGTVVTGSLISGRVRQGEAVWVLPSKKAPLRARVRGIQVHGNEREEALCGQRVALNLAGIPAEELRRGQVVLAAGYGTPSKILDTSFNLLAGEELVRPGEKVRFYAGTTEVMGRIARLRNAEEGRGLLMRLVLEDDVLVFIGDPFILRAGNAGRTLGGGRILELPQKPGKNLAPFEEGAGEASRLLRLAFRGESSGLLTEDQLLKAIQLSPVEGKNFLKDSAEKGTLLFLPEERRYALGESVRDLKEKIVSLLRRLHEASFWQWGWRGGEIRAYFSGISSRLLDFCINRLVTEKRLVRRDERFLLSGFTPSLDSGREEIRRLVRSAFEEAAFQPPSMDELKIRVGGMENQRLLKEVLEFMRGSGEMAETGEGIFFLSSALDEARKKLSELSRARGSFTPAECRDALASSRKYVIPLLEYFDRTGFTRREGEGRVISGC